MRIKVLLFSFLLLPFHSFAQTEEYHNDLVYIVQENGKEGLMDLEGKWIAAPQFDEIKYVDCGFIVFISGNKYGVADKSGHTLITPRWEWAMLDDFNTVQVQRQNETALVSMTTLRRISGWYPEMEIFLDGYLAVKNAQGHWGFLDQYGWETISCRYDSVANFDNGAAHVWRQGRDYFINAKGHKRKRPDGYTPIDSLYPDLRFEVNGKVGVLNSKGDTIMQPVYDEIAFSAGEYYTFRLKGKYGIADRNGRFICQPTFDFIDHAYSDGAVARQGDRYGIIDLTGNTIIPFQFQHLEPMLYDHAIAELSGKWGVIDNQSNWILQPQYSYIRGMYHKDDLKDCSDPE